AAAAVVAVAGRRSAAGPARPPGSRPLHVGTALSPIPFTPPVPSFTQFVNSPITRPGVLRSEPSHHSPRLRGRRGVRRRWRSHGETRSVFNLNAGVLARHPAAAPGAHPALPLS